VRPQRPAPAIVREGKGVVDDPHGPSRGALLCLGCGKMPPHTGSEAICPACVPPNGTCDCPGCRLVAGARSAQGAGDVPPPLSCGHGDHQRVIVVRECECGDSRQIDITARAAPPGAERTAAPESAPIHWLGDCTDNRDVWQLARLRDRFITLGCPTTLLFKMDDGTRLVVPLGWWIYDWHTEHPRVSSAAPSPSREAERSVACRCQFDFAAGMFVPLRECPAHGHQVTP
jgi:hypothetical protein